MHQITLLVSQNVLVNHTNEHSCHSMRSKCPPPACAHNLRWSRQHWRCSGQIQNKFGSSIFAGRRCHESLFHRHFAV